MFERKKAMGAEKKSACVCNTDVPKVACGRMCRATQRAHHIKY